MVLLWGAETVCSPSWRNLNASFESWAYRNGFNRRLDYLAREKLVQKRRRHGIPNVEIRLTERGRLAALGGRDPVERWNRPWDGIWRIFLFDFPQHDHGLRLRVWRQLRAHGFGFLQQSVWVTPLLEPDWTAEWGAKASNVRSYVSFEGRPSGATDAEIVAGAWDFSRINSAAPWKLEPPLVAQ